MWSISWAFFLKFLGEVDGCENDGSSDEQADAG